MKTWDDPLTHTLRERAMRESPWGLLFWCVLNAQGNSCRHECVISKKTLLLNIKPPKKPINSTTRWGLPHRCFLSQLRLKPLHLCEMVNLHISAAAYQKMD